MRTRSTRDDILEATKTLLWQKGYEATSPRDILAMSQAGQGSLYHHFPSKQKLACVAIQEIVDERIAEFDQIMSARGSFKHRVMEFISRNDQPLRGCRVGRLVWDAAVEEDELRKPLEQYFRHVEGRLASMLDTEQALGHLKLTLRSTQIALIIVSVVQGSFAVSRAMHASRADDARDALSAFLDLAVLKA
jgi:TetR/AcrR family transcriptional regulator, transcriptional repressor for nem operon